MLAMLFCVHIINVNKQYLRQTQLLCYSLKHYSSDQKLSSSRVQYKSLKNKVLHLQDDRFLIDHVVFKRILGFASDGNFICLC